MTIGSEVCRRVESWLDRDKLCWIEIQLFVGLYRSLLLLKCVCMDVPPSPLRRCATLEVPSFVTFPLILLRGSSPHPA